MSLLQLPAWKHSSGKTPHEPSKSSWSAIDEQSRATLELIGGHCNGHAIHTAFRAFRAARLFRGFLVIFNREIFQRKFFTEQTSIWALDGALFAHRKP